MVSQKQNALTIKSEIQLTSFSDAMKFAEVMAKSGAFPDTPPALALAKIQTGAELGFGPMASLRGVYIVHGRTGLYYTMVGACVRRHGYDYEVTEHTPKKCTIRFLRGAKVLGESTYTIDDAKRAGLLRNQNYEKNPLNMLFARAMTNGQRFYCPDATNGLPIMDEFEMEVMDHPAQVSATVEHQSHAEAILDDLGAADDAPEVVDVEPEPEVEGVAYCTRAQYNAIREMVAELSELSGETHSLKKLGAEIIGREVDGSFSKVVTSDEADQILDFLDGEIQSWRQRGA